MRLFSQPLVTMFATFGLAAFLAGCPSGGKGGVAGEPQWPISSKIATTPLPGTVSWTGVYFINTPGTRGTMHLFEGNEGKVHGCWLAEDKHAKATFVGESKDNLVKLDWTEKRIGFAGAPVHLTAYFVMTPDVEGGKHLIKGEYGNDISSDGGSPWEGIRQKNAEPKEDGCKLDEGETVPVETKPLE